METWKYVGGERGKNQNATQSSGDLCLFLRKKRRWKKADGEKGAELLTARFLSRGPDGYQCSVPFDVDFSNHTPPREWRENKMGERL